MNITITPNPAFAHYTHSTPIGCAETLRRHVLELSACGYDVIHAVSERPSVPNCYRFADKVTAVAWFLDGDTGTIKQFLTSLETRSRGRVIPAHIWLRGRVPTPSGYRCLKRTDRATKLISCGI